MASLTCILSPYLVTLLLVVLVHEPGLVEVAHGALLVVVCNLALMREPPPQNCTSVWCISNVHDVSRGEGAPSGCFRAHDPSLLMVVLLLKVPGLCSTLWDSTSVDLWRPCIWRTPLTSK